MGFIFRSLDLGVYDHCMFWVARNLAYFGFLRSAEFTVPNLATFSADVHLGVSDIAVATATLPSCPTVLIKASKTDPFCKGCFVHIGRGNAPLSAIESLMAYLAKRGNSEGPLFLLRMGAHYQDIY